MVHSSGKKGGARVEDGEQIFSNLEGPVGFVLADREGKPGRGRRKLAGCFQGNVYCARQFKELMKIMQSQASALMTGGCS